MGNVIGKNTMTRAAILAKIAELEQKLRAAKTEDGKHYYALCLAGWRRMLEKTDA